MIYLYNEKNRKKISENFNSKEFECPCCNYALLCSRTILMVQSVRHYLNKRVDVISGYRCPKHNKKIGGGEYSRHLMGLAADLGWEGMKEDLKPGSTFRKWVSEHGNEYHIFGVGIGETKFHIDCDTSRKHLTFWEY